MLGLEGAIKKALGECDLILFDTSAINYWEHGLRTRSSRDTPEAILYKEILLYCAKGSRRIRVTVPVFKEMERGYRYFRGTDSEDVMKRLVNHFDDRKPYLTKKMEMQFKKVRKLNRNIRDWFKIHNTDYYTIALATYLAKKQPGQAVAVFSNDKRMMRALDTWCAQEKLDNVHAYTAMWSGSFDRFNNGH